MNINSVIYDLENFRNKNNLLDIKIYDIDDTKIIENCQSLFVVDKKGNRFKIIKHRIMSKDVGKIISLENLYKYL